MDCCWLLVWHIEDGIDLAMQMNFYGEVRVQKGDSRDRTVYVVDVKKDIKQ